MSEDTTLSGELTLLNAIAHSLDDTISESDRMEDVYESGVIALEAFDQDGEVGTNVVMLARSNVKAMLAGTGISDGFDDPMSLEGFSDTNIGKAAILTASATKAAAKGIMMAGERLWDELDEFYTRTLASTDTMSSALKKLNKRLDYTQGKEADSDIITLKGLYFVLSVDGKNARNAKDIIDNIHQMTKVCDVVFGSWLKNVQTTGEDLLRIVKQYDSKKTIAHDLIGELTKTVEKLDFNKLQNQLHAVKRSDPRYDKDVYVSPALSGNASIFIHRPDTHLKLGASTVEKATAVRNRTIKFIRTNPKVNWKLDEVKLPVLTVDEIVDIKEACQGLLDVLEKHSRSGTGQSVVKIGEQMQKHLQQEMSIIERSLNMGDTLYTANIYRFSSAYVKWATQPMNSLFPQAMALIRASIKVCNKSIAAHN